MLQYPKSWFVPATLIMPALLFMAAGLLPGCSTQSSWTSYQEKGFEPSVLADGNVILGGVVMFNRVTLDKFSGVEFSPEEFTPTVQANLWAPLFRDAYLRRATKKPAVDWFHFSSRVPEETWMKMLELHARQSLITPDLLADCHNAFPDIPYLLMTRVDHTILDSRHRVGYGLQHASGRLMTMTLDVYDLEKGLSAYTFSREYYDNGPGNPGFDEIEDRIRIQLPDSTGGDVEVAGYVIKAPTVASVIEKCLYALLESMYFYTEKSKYGE